MKAESLEPIRATSSSLCGAQRTAVLPRRTKGDRLRKTERTAVNLDLMQRFNGVHRQ